MHFVPWIQHLFALSLLVALPIVEARYDRRLKQFTDPERRTGWYRINIVVLCALAIVAVALAYPMNLLLPAGRESVALWRGAHPAVFAGAAVLVAAYACLTLGQGLKAAMSQGLRLKIVKAMQPLRFALPVTVRERRWWILVSLAAGVCEEILYRGFVPHYFSGSLAAAIPLGTVGAWLTASLFFGFAHAYQGVAGIVRTTLAGSILGSIALLSGGLLLPIVLHFVFDLQVLWMYRPLVDEPDIAARLIEGCEP
jgi:membrane protease YdiL (CAAX protease family)